jgi:hypothetical protein
VICSGRDTVRTPTVRLPLHAVGIVTMKCRCSTAVTLEEPSRQCEFHARLEFFLTLAPLPFAGSAVNPLAIF